ncbi:restriction endonuclease subunit S [Labilibaculum filiforme]|uniref:restriction endonuclease subunit S n=1 Tax=Labilibaculum filiforme TaxID=1940526 RepID=UPI001FE755F2|nr:restriction endonuclease subunit S [Labilibaculum filiforme]
MNKTAPKVDFETPYKMLRTTNVRNGKIDTINCKYVTKEIFEKWTRRAKVLEGDVLLTREAPLGEVGRITSNDNLFLGQRLMQYRANPNKLDSRFLLYSFRSADLQHQFQMHEGTGSVVSHIRVPDCLKFKLDLPALSEQKRIAHILGSLDNKIELNRQMNQTLEQMAQALFKSWFVDFDPVIDNALAVGNSIPEELQAKAEKRKALGKDRKTLPEEIQKLFPNELEYSKELEKWVPLGWRVGKISDVADVIGGGTPSTKVDEYFSEKGIPWLSPKDLSGYEWKYISRGAKDISPLGLSKSSAKLMPKRSVLFSSRAPIGYVAIAENEVSTNQGFKSLVPNQNINSEYLYCFLKSKVEDIEAIATGSTFKEVSGAAFKNFPILIPDINILKNYQEKTDDWNNKRLTNQKQVESLTKLRDTLLPKLISGEVRVPDIEGMIENKNDK